jgi:hypothetical protein
MLARALLSPILNNDALTRGLGDAEARMLVEWLVEQAERRAPTGATEGAVEQLIQAMYRRARAIGRFVGLWCHEGARGAAGQLAAAERFSWPLPSARVDPCELMHSILAWEAREPSRLKAL